jgi:short-subunit dehydrogenase
MTNTVFITGTSTGIGRASAILFAENGWNVIAGMRTPQKEETLNTYKNILIAQLDITNPESIERAIQQGIEQFGRIDALVNNAAFGQYGLFEAISTEDIRQQFEVNVFGTMNVIRAILPHFRKNKEGAIINISSAGGRIGIPVISMYVSSKFALEGFSEAVSYELASQNIKVKLIEPGGVDTAFHATSREKYATDERLTDYQSYTEKFAKKFETMYDNLASAVLVAQEIFKAATDNSNQFRYVVGEDAKGWIQLRTSKPDQEFTDLMRSSFEV